VPAIDGPVLVRLTGADPEARAGVAAELAERLGGGTLAIRDAVAASLDPVDTAALLDREALADARLVVTASEPLLGLLEAEVVVTDAPATVPGRTTLARTVPSPTPAEQVSLWRAALGAPSFANEPGLEEASRELAHHFRFSPRAIAAACAEWRSLGAPDADALRRLARDRARIGFGMLAQRIDPRARWDDLVLPDGQLEVLRDLERHVRHRARVHDDWGFAGRGERGLGVSAMFTGESGTGKTMAAEVVAGSLGLDLFRVDLAALVSKYIGETEKHLADVFDAAESSGAVLLFDEADALFGRRSEVKDSHDRYANLEVAYLLQRMESYRGLAILTTNLRANVDRAFLRRIRFLVQFPFPDAPARAEIWSRVFPAETPTEGLDPAVLGKMQLTGGSIRQVAISAAFAAADAGIPVRPAHVLRAAQLEAAKSERTLTDAETGGLRRGGAPT
jgi:vesicle-fusing ATPase